VLKRFVAVSFVLTGLVAVTGLLLQNAHTVAVDSAAWPMPEVPAQLVADGTRVPGGGKNAPSKRDAEASETLTPRFSPEGYAVAPLSTHPLAPALISSGTITFTPIVTLYMPAMFHEVRLPDLTVQRLWITLRTGHSCNYTSTVLGVRIFFENTGHAGAGPFVVEVNGAQQYFASGLGAGLSDSLWFPGYVAFDENVGIVDATFLVTESDETNNVYAQVLPVPTLPPTCTPTAGGGD
jgi:hypothetical protein